MPVCCHFVAHHGAGGLSPDGWLPDRISVGVLPRAFPPDLVDEVIEATGTRELRRRLLPARLVVYFVLALWLFRGRDCGFGQGMGKMADAVFHPRRCAEVPAGRLVPAGWVGAGGCPGEAPPNSLVPSRTPQHMGGH